MNSAYIGKLMELAEKDGNILHLLADSGTGYDEMFRRNFPDRIFNFGIGEENMVAAAAGMASVGKKPYVFTAGAFLAYRSFEFIRDDVCFQNLNVKIVGMGSGLSWSSLGPTHHTTEDVAVLRTIPNLRILSPASPEQVRRCVQEAYEYDGPVYIRIGMNREKEFFDGLYKYHPLKNDVLMDGNDIAVISTGSILEEAYSACESLKKDGLGVRLSNAVSIKPFDEEDVLDISSRFDKVFTIEEHNTIGGLAGIVSEINSFRGLGMKVIPIGLKDIFAEGYGSHKLVRERNGLDAESIYNIIKEALRDE